MSKPPDCLCPNCQRLLDQLESMQALLKVADLRLNRLLDIDPRGVPWADGRPRELDLGRR